MENRLVKIIWLITILETIQWAFSSWIVYHITTILTGGLLFSILFAITYKDSIFKYFLLNNIVNLSIVIQDNVFIDKYDYEFGIIGTASLLMLWINLIKGKTKWKK